MSKSDLVQKFTRHSWLIVLIATSLASLGAYSYFRGLNEQFIKSEVTHRSELLLHDIREVIQQHIDATEGMSAYVRAELSAHQSIVEFEEAQELLRGMVTTHPGEFAQAAIFPPDTSSAISYADASEQAPPIVWADFPKLAPNALQLVPVQSGKGYLLLRLFQSICVQKICGYNVTDLNTHNLINRALEAAARNNLNIDLFVRVGFVENIDEIPLYIHSDSPQANGNAIWDGGFELLGSQFLVHAIAPPQLIQHLTSQTADWVLALGLILGLLLTHLAYDRARYGEQLRLKVDKRTQELSDERQKLAAVIDNAAESILAMGEDGSISRANPAACGLFGYQPDEWQGLTVHDLVPEEMREQHQQWFTEEMTGKRHDMLGKTRELKGRRKDGSIFPCEVTVTEFEAAGERRLSVILRDLTERKKAEKKLIQLSYYDELTGLPNRRLFSDRLERVLALEGLHDRQVSVIYLCLARFKEVTETLGKNVGDDILKDVARRLDELLRESDTLARVSNSTFAVLLPETDVNQTADFSLQIIQAMDIPFHIHQREISLGVNLGVAVFPDDGRDAEMLMRRVAAAMTYAKRNKLPTHYFSSHMEEQMKRRLRMEQDLSKAAAGNQMEMYYQAKHQIIDGAVCGFESLIRWLHPERGIVSPAEFIPLAEDTGLIQPITRWVLADVARQAVVWEQAGIRPGRIGVNISAVQLMEKGLAKEILALIEEAGAKPGWFEIEITETAAMHEPDTAVSIMLELAEAGISLAIDDFGTGYSSLAYLKRLPAKWLKIDISFIRGLPDDEEDAAIVRSTIAMAHALGMKTVAEGVETKEQLEFLRGVGCDTVQGYLFCKPLPANQATDHIKANLKLKER